MPTHIIVGEFDHLTPPAISAEMAKRIVGSKLTIIPDAGHLSNMEAPAAFNRAAGDFLAKVRQLAELRNFSEKAHELANEDKTKICRTV